MLAAVLSFTACGNKEEAGYDEESMEQVAEFIINYCSTADETAFEQWYDMSDFAVDLQLNQAGLPLESESFISVLKGWQAGVDECGAYLGHDDYTYKVQNGSVEMSAPAQFDTRDGELTFVFDAQSGQMESLTVSADMETGEILEKAALNTLLGMGTVFSVLILIAVLISLFNFIPKLQAAFSKKAEKPVPGKAEEGKEEAAGMAEPAPVFEEEIDDGELIAVIAAAVAAAEGTTTDGFVVRSIRRRSQRNWNLR